MPPKKQPRNPFFFFMLDYQKREEARGVRFPGGLKDVSNACSEEWQNMSGHQKGHYEARAKDAKVRDGVSGMKYTSQGVPITLIEKEAKLKQDFENTMNDYIKFTVTQSKLQELMNKRFYFIHVNHLCRKLLPNGEGDFLPVEFAVTEFSLVKGVEHTYHEIIDIDVPMGYRFEAKQHEEETHKICPNPPGGNSNFGVMYQNLRDLLRPEIVGEQLPPLYTTRGIVEIVPGLLSRMAKAAGRSVDIFRVYSLETLFFHMHNTVVPKSDCETRGFPALSLAEKEILKDRFDQALGIACAYHTDINESAVHCSRSIVVRWAYIICDFCCFHLGIDMQPGNHCPLNTDVDAIERSKEDVFRQPVTYTQPANNRGLVSMTGVTEEHRVKTSERTYREEQERRQNCQPLLIIDHSKLQESSRQEVKTAPKAESSGVPTYSDRMRKTNKGRRLPNTKPTWAVGASTEKVPNMDEMNFPAIGGRGGGLRTNRDEFPPIGRGRGLPFGN